MGQGSSVTASEPGSGTGQPDTWGELKAMIIESIKKDHLPHVFEHLLTDVRNYLIELK